MNSTKGLEWCQAGIDATPLDAGEHPIIRWECAYKHSAPRLIARHCRALDASLITSDLHRAFAW
jgi:hypothetical protein